MMVFVAACIVSPWGGQGFVQGISVTAFLSALALFLMHMFGLIARFPGPWQFIVSIHNSYTHLSFVCSPQKLFCVINCAIAMCLFLSRTLHATLNVAPPSVLIFI
jgi:hypothetical protein